MPFIQSPEKNAKLFLYVVLILIYKRFHNSVIATYIIMFFQDTRTANRCALCIYHTTSTSIITRFTFLFVLGIFAFLEYDGNRVYAADVSFASLSETELDERTMGANENYFSTSRHNSRRRNEQVTVESKLSFKQEKQDQLRRKETTERAILVLGNATCPVVETVADFNIESYAARPWYSHQQAVNLYLPKRLNYCVRAEYNVRDRPSIPWRYTVDVYNKAQDKNGNIQDGNLCAYQTDLDNGQPGKLAVAPCYLPKAFAGPYWVLLYNEEEGYALISGGQPSIPSYDQDGMFLGCRTGRGINNSGLWIFSRSPLRDEDLIASVRAKAVEMGIDVTILNDVDQEGCYDDDLLSPTAVPTFSSKPTIHDQNDEEKCSDATEPFQLWLQPRVTQDCNWVKQKPWWRCMFYSKYCSETCGVCTPDRV